MKIFVLPFKKASFLLIAVVMLHSAKVCKAYDCFTSSDTLRRATQGIHFGNSDVGYNYIDPSNATVDYGPIER